MGVPSFFLWLVNHYSKELLFEDYPYEESPDNLYLDFNCAIHPAVKKDGIETIEDMYQAVCNYLENIMKYTKPKKVLYIAVDGVAPLAKMKQQRIRRFKTVQDRRELDKIDRNHNRVISKFDFNMISPGTKFMLELTEKLKNYIKTYLQPKYGYLNIIFDDASNPGEGEHKIMYHIRTKTTSKDSIIVYGLDSDLIFLCLIHYQQHKNFCIFREKIFFDDGDKKDNIENNLSPFTYLHIENFRKIILSIMTPTLNKDQLNDWGILNPYKDRLHGDTNFTLVDPDQLTKSNDLIKISNTSFKSKNEIIREIDMKMYDGDLKLNKNDENRLILDYTAMCFLLGNDFLTHIPSLKIKEGGLNRVIESYKDIQMEYPNNYLVNEDKMNFNLPFLIKFLSKIGQYEDPDLIKQTEASQLRISKFANSYRVRNAEPYEREKLQWEYIEDKYVDVLKMGQPDWKQRYYQYYLGENTNESKNDMIINYITGLYWVLRYYTGNNNLNTCPDWEWFYYYRVAPTINDLADFFRNHDGLITSIINNMKPNQPVTPDVQLLLILPPQSSDLLNPKLQKLMFNIDSPIIFQYPSDFQIDMMDHRFRWECYPILPNVDLNLTKLTAQVLLDSTTWHVKAKEITEIFNEEPIKLIEEPNKQIKEPIKLIEEPNKQIEEPNKQIEEPNKQIKEPNKQIKEPIKQNDEYSKEKNELKRKIHIHLKTKK